MRRGNLIRNLEQFHGLIYNEQMRYFSFEVYKLLNGELLEFETGEKECGIVVLSGKCDIMVNNQKHYVLGQRTSIFEGIPPHVLIVPAHSAVRLGACDLAHFSVSKVQSRGGTEVFHILPSQITGVSRGDGNTLRTVYDLIPKSVSTPLMLYEVYVPSGNWAGFPPHKHDTENPPLESLLEESYYFAFDPPNGFAFQWIYNDDFSMDTVYSVRTGDLMLIPEGYHPLVAAPGYTCYQHCVMAGPSREWNFKLHNEYAHLLNWSK